MGYGFKYIEMSKTYKYVSKVENNGKIKFRGTNVKGVNTKMFDTEREAAIAVDKALLNKGFLPVNILIKK